MIGDPLAARNSAPITFGGKLLNTAPAAFRVLPVLDDGFVGVVVTSFELQLEKANPAISINPMNVEARRKGVQNFFFTCGSVFLIFRLLLD